MFHSCAFFIRRKTEINCLLKAGEQRSGITKKIYLLLLIELDVLKALKGLLFLVSAYLKKIRDVS